MISLDLESPFAPRQAIILYQNENKYYLESHTIYFDQDNKSFLSEGKPLQKETIMQIAKQFSTDNQLKFTCKQLLPNNLIYVDTQYGNSTFVWFLKPQRNPLFFTSNLAIPNGQAFCPGLVFVAKNKTLSVFAFRGDIVNLRTKLYIAPFHNIYKDGKVCLGNAKIENVEGEYENVLTQWQKIFFGSEFSNLLVNSSPTKTNINLLWKDLISNGAKFPVEELLPHPIKTIKQLIETL
ncbi:hypothetical protein [Xanthocytophaga flava]|uniref:hypothetical protein n=1 Tax=Xanthocytophaga flava TaxID=3048013 RepID=UPI0028D43F1C|nr:hypothetical protein [Xanthocytophaga flavus]MDJ1470214.1 hypothetical protein [Xanthocytophaga flavus]